MNTGGNQQVLDAEEAYSQAADRNSQAVSTKLHSAEKVFDVNSKGDWQNESNRELGGSRNQQEESEYLAGRKSLTNKSTLKTDLKEASQQEN